jgi:hypothetical protein
VKFAAALAAILALVGCDQPISEEASRQLAAQIEYNRRVESLPIRPASGKVTMQEVAAIFAKGCLPDFDDVQATLANLKRAGLTTEETLGWDAGENGLRSDAKGIAASMGLQRYGEREFGNVCQVQAKVRDPQSDPVAALNAVYRDIAFDTNGMALVVRGEQTLRIFVGKPGLVAEVPKLAGAGSLANLDLADPAYWVGAHRQWGQVYYGVDWAPR